MPRKRSSGRTARHGPLSGLRVLELATVVAGPSVGKYLADFGADVIKVEPPDGDSTRSMGWLDPNDGVSLFFKLVNRGKRGIRLDLKTDGDRRTAEALLGDADVLIENMRPGKLEALGLDPATLLKRNPSLVIVRVTGFGQFGPLSMIPGFATTAEALSGLSSLMGEQGGGPSLPPVAMTDELAGLVGAFAALAAVHHVNSGGPGQVVDVSLLESVLQILGPLPSAWAQLGYLQGRQGARLPYSVPRGVYLTRDDRWVAVSASSESVARRLLKLLSMSDPSLLSFGGRYDARDEIESRLRGWIRDRDESDVLAALEGVQAAVAPVLDMSEVIEHPQVRSLGAIVDVDGMTMQGLVARFDGTPGSIRHAGVRPTDGHPRWLDARELRAGRDPLHG